MASTENRTENRNEQHDGASVDYEGRNRTFLPHPEASRYNLVATFPTPEAAGRAVEALHSNGFTNDDVHVLGTAEDAVTSGIGVSRNDQKVVQSAAMYGVGGTVAGAVLGALIGIAIMAVPSFQHAIGIHASAGSYLLAAAFGAIAGSVLGVAGGIWGLDRRRSGTRTFGMQQTEGATMVGVHAEDDAHTQAAADAFRSAGAAEVKRYSTGSTIVA